MKHRVGQGGFSDPAKVVKDSKGRPTLHQNPSRIDPANPAWDASRKPLVVEFEDLETGRHYVMTNVHYAAMSGGPARDPIRVQQAQLTADFLKEFKGSGKTLVISGDMNALDIEGRTPPLKVLDDAGFSDPAKDWKYINNRDANYDEKTDPTTYVYKGRRQRLDYFFVEYDPKTQEISVVYPQVNKGVTYKNRPSDHNPGLLELREKGMDQGQKR